MKRLKYILIGLLLPILDAAALTIETAYTRYYEEGGIRPISQYFGASLTGQGFRTVVPSKSEEPAGQYFILGLKGAKNVRAQVARMTLYTSASKEPETHSWTLDGTQLDNWLYLGLTGSDWPGKEIRPLAWHIELLDSSGNVQAEWKSFLWELP